MVPPETAPTGGMVELAEALVACFGASFAALPLTWTSDVGSTKIGAFVEALLPAGIPASRWRSASAPASFRSLSFCLFFWDLLSPPGCESAPVPSFSSSQACLAHLQVSLLFDDAIADITKRGEAGGARRIRAANLATASRAEDMALRALPDGPFVFRGGWRAFSMCSR
jgi:hypothetical protein